jgi:hypothetical protein
MDVGSPDFTISVRREFFNEPKPARPIFLCSILKKGKFFKNLRDMPAQKPGASDDRPFIFGEHFGPPLQARNPMMINRNPMMTNRNIHPVCMIKCNEDDSADTIGKLVDF